MRRKTRTHRLDDTLQPIDFDRFERRRHRASSLNALLLMLLFLVSLALAGVIGIYLVVRWCCFAGVESSEPSLMWFLDTHGSSLFQGLLILATLAAIGRQARHAVHNYHAEAKRGMRQATIEQLRSTTDNYRRLDRRLISKLAELGEKGYVEQGDDLMPHALVGEDPPDLELSYERGAIKYHSVEEARELARVLFKGILNRHPEGAPAAESGLIEDDVSPITMEQAEFLHSFLVTRSVIRQMLSCFEQLGVGVARKCYGFIAVVECEGSTIVDAYIKWEKFIQCRRGSLRHNHSFSQFEWLASCIVQYRAARILKVLARGEYPSHRAVAKDWLEKAKKDQFVPEANDAFRRRKGSQLTALLDALKTNEHATHPPSHNLHRTRLRDQLNRGLELLQQEPAMPAR